MSRYNFIGTIGINALDSKVPWKREAKTKNGNDYISLTLNIIAAQNNRTWVEGVGFKQDVIKTRDENKNAIEIPWDERKDPEQIKKVPFWGKHVVQIGDTREEFITDYDFMEYVANHIDEIKDKTVQITGQIGKDFYNGNIRDRFRMGNLFVKSEDDKVKKGLKITTIFFWDKDGIDLADWKTEKKIRINGYTEEYIDKDNGRKYVPQTLVFDCSRVNFEDEKNVKAVNFRLKQLGLAYDDDKVSVKLKRGKYYTNEIEISYVNGAEEIAFSEDELTETQKEAISLGLAELNDFKPKGQIYGNRKTEWKITGFALQGSFVDGIQEMDVTASEFEDDIYTPPKAETLEDAMNKPESDDDPEDLFS